MRLTRFLCNVANRHFLQFSRFPFVDFTAYRRDCGGFCRISSGLFPQRRRNSPEKWGLPVLWALFRFPLPPLPLGRYAQGFLYAFNGRFQNFVISVRTDILYPISRQRRLFRAAIFCRRDVKTPSASYLDAPRLPADRAGLLLRSWQKLSVFTDFHKLETKKIIEKAKICSIMILIKCACADHAVFLPRNANRERFFCVPEKR